MNSDTSHKRGFTLIELLVVVAIIAVLTSLAMVFLATARERSRDARRMSDMRNFQNALGLYQASHGGIYPVSPVITINGTNDALSIALEAGGYIFESPIDPLHPNLVYQYGATTTGSYTILFCLETDQYDNLGFQRGCGNSVVQ